MVKQEDLSKVTLITILGLSILIGTLFWLKGYKYHNEKRIKVCFSDVSGLEEGSVVRWSGLRVGVIESIVPYFITQNPKKTEKNKFLDLYDKEIEKVKILEEKFLSIKDEKEKQKLDLQIKQSKDIAEVYKQQLIAFQTQQDKLSKNHVELSIVITKKGVPLGPLSKISIVPTGFVGDQFVEITPIIGKKSYLTKFEPVYFTQEPLRFERLMRANIESSEAFKEAIIKVNELINQDDIALLRATVQDAKSVVVDVNKLVNNAGVLLGTTTEKLEQLADSSNRLSASVVEVGQNLNRIIGDEQLRKDIKDTTASLSQVSSEIAKLLNEEGLSKDILTITQNTKDTSTEVASFIKDLRQTHDQLEIPQTISNLNQLAEKLDTLTTQLNEVVSDPTVREDVKVTIRNAKETSENLEKATKKLNKRFLLFRLLF